MHDAVPDSIYKMHTVPDPTHSTSGNANICCWSDPTHSTSGNANICCWSDPTHSTSGNANICCWSDPTHSTSGNANICCWSDPTHSTSGNANICCWSNRSASHCPLWDHTVYKTDSKRHGWHWHASMPCRPTSQSSLRSVPLLPAETYSTSNHSQS